MIFRDRIQAARLLARALDRYVGAKPLVLAIPRGAVPMGRVLADELGGELDVVLVRKLGAPGQPELAIGAVDESGHVLLKQVGSAFGVDEDYVAEESRHQHALLRARRRKYTPDRPPIPPTGRIVIVLDDGAATGATMIAALRATRRARPRELIAAAAVMPPETRDLLAGEADRVVCLATPELFGAVGQFFADFPQVSDDEVVAALLAGADAGQSTGGPSPRITRPATSA